MPKIRNVSDSDLLLGVLGRVVPMDEVVEVSQDVFDEHVWPESLWRVVGASKTNSKDKE